MEKRAIYNLVGMMALEFRLSLNDICKLYGKEPTEQNQMEIYENIIKTTNRDKLLIEQFNYLFFFETSGEKVTISQFAYLKAKNFLQRYKKARKEGDREKFQAISSELRRTETEFKAIEEKLPQGPLNAREIEIITKYRIKNVIPRKTFGRQYGIPESTLKGYEEKLESHIIKAKLEKLSEYSAIMASKAAMKKKK